MKTKILILTSILILGGCSVENKTIKPKQDKIDSIIKEIPTKNKISLIIKNAIEQIQKGDYEKATHTLNQGLKLSPDNSHLHFLNALNYHIQSLNGNVKMRDFAKVGYITSLKFDDSNYWALYLLGNIFFNEKEYKKAQNNFAHAILFDENNPYLLRALSVASYYCHDIALSSWASKKAYKVDPNNIASLRNLIFSQVASGNTNIATKTLEMFNNVIKQEKRKKNLSIDELVYKKVTKRVQDWKHYYNNQQNNSNQNDDTSSIFGDDDEENNDDESTNTVVNKQTGTLPKMTLVDVILIQTEEVRSQAKGVNLLDALKVSLGGVLYSKNLILGDNQTNSDIVNPTFEFAELYYNLNIFNDGINKAEVLARPSLLAIENKTSNFYSGSTLHVQLNSSNGDASIDDVPIGIHLSITPTFYEDDTVQIDVKAKRSFLETMSENVGFISFTQTSQTSVEATAILKFGETLILSGLTHATNDNTKNGTPFLQNIPGVQYLFSRSEQAQVKKSVLILVTPRKPRYYNEILTNAQIRELEDKKNKQETYYTRLLIKKENITATNSEAILSHFENNELYRQFRSGDLKLDDWNNEDTLEGSIKRIAEFLYY